MSPVSKYRFAEEPAAPLEGSWVKVLEARHYGNQVDISPADLDSIVRNYGSRTQDAPIGVGPNRRGAAVLGYVGDLRKNGSGLEAKVTRVSPSLDSFQRETGTFPKTLVAIQKSDANGPSLQRVAFMRSDNSWPEVKDEGPGVDAFGNQEVVFAENSQASRIVNRLKASGHWCPVFDRHKFPTILESLQASDTMIQFGEGEQKRAIHPMEAFARFIELTSEMIGVSGGAGQDADLARAALGIARSKSISYSEALDRAVANREYARQDESFSEGSGYRYNGVELHRAARRVASERGMSYSEALDHVVCERPELGR